MGEIYYDITSTDSRIGGPHFHQGQEYGYAYDTSTHFVHFFGRSNKLFEILYENVVVQKKNGLLTDWVINTFGAQNINNLSLGHGKTIEGVWRPGLSKQEAIFQGINTTEAERRLSEQAIRILVEKLDDILLYVEPCASSLITYSHKIRELLILACTEVENFWGQYMTLAGVTPSRSNGFNTNDYVRLSSKLFLHEYKFNLRGYASLPAFTPFLNWQSSSPTTSIPWYDAYNKTKHNRVLNFSRATLKDSIDAVVACIILYIVRFSPAFLKEGLSTFSSIINQHFDFELTSPVRASFYLPFINIPNETRYDFNCYSPFLRGHFQPFNVLPLTV